jgi:hypothetical protein
MKGITRSEIDLRQTCVKEMAKIFALFIEYMNKITL